MNWIEGIFSDLRFAMRGLRRDGAFTITAIVTLALAIGLNVTVSIVMNAMLFRGFPQVSRNDRLMYMQERNPLNVCCLSYLDFEDWRAQAKSFKGMAFLGGKPITFGEAGGGRALETFACTIGSNAFELLGVQPMLGRDFLSADETPGAPAVAIVSYRFWETRLGKRADIVGHTVLINKAPATVIGVMPRGFDFPEQENLWMPLEHTAELQQRTPGGYMAFGRLAEGATAAGARAELETINRRLAAAYPATNRGVVPRVETYSQFFIGPDAPVIYGSLWAAAWFVLLIACANLANLTLARTIGRSREFSTRIALGAGHWRVARPILTESLLLAGAGGVFAWWIAKWGVRTWAAATESQYQILDYTVDLSTGAYLVAISIAAVALFAFVPVGRLLRLDVNGILKGDARGTSPGLRSKRFSAALVAGQMALAMVLLSGTGILARSFMKLVGADTGVTNPEKILIGSVALPRDKYPSSESRVALFDNLRLRLLETPGVESASIANAIPVGNPGMTPFELEAWTHGTQGVQGVPVLDVGTDYFHTVGAKTLAGREFNDLERASGPPVAIVNQSFAAKFFPGEDPLGKQLRLYRREKPGEWRTIVGVVSNIMQAEPTRQHFVPLVYVPFRQEPASNAWFFARTRAASEGVAGAVRATLQKLDPDLALDDFSTLQASFKFIAARMDREHSEMGKHAAVAPIFAVIALLLAVIGLYAVVAHSVGQRTKEIGIRMAIGAAANDIRQLVFREGMLPVGIGLAAGLAASLGVNRVLESQLVGVSPYDPVTLAIAPALLILVALLGCQIPARRAMHVDPAVALRHD